LHFDSLAAIQAGFGSPEGKAAGADVPKFATGGADIAAVRQSRSLNGIGAALARAAVKQGRR